ncbi:hypothetical protein F2Q69_00035870 [Brassica cretica]|uniref:Uncharacterized protein n=2 Tax=Brassica TaxID=3705 RepID=A0A8S9SJ84_BRACR|nr:hypothetical protein F2Q69_00035870 [Brassica cretica]
MWSIKKEDFAMKERLSRMKLLESLIAKQEPLAEYEEALKKKLISELLLQLVRGNVSLRRDGVTPPIVDDRK